MVDNSIILNIFNELLKPSEKCLSLARIKEKLTSLSDTDKLMGLTRNNFLNPVELEYYQNLYDMKKTIIDNIRENEEKLKEDPNDDYSKLRESLIKNMTDNLNELEDTLFSYERRLFDGYEPPKQKEIDVDFDKFELDNTNDLFGGTDWNDTLGDIERVMVNDTLKSKLESSHVNALRSYFDDAYLLNSFLNNGSMWNGLSKSEQDYMRPNFNKLSNLLSDAISRTGGLKKDTVLFHAGKFDPSKVVGDHIKFKGFTSTSFSRGFAEDYVEGTVYNNLDGSVEYIYAILAPTGTKGVSANTRPVTLTEHHEEHEYLLDKGFEGDIVSIDVDNHIVYVTP